MSKVLLGLGLLVLSLNAFAAYPYSNYEKVKSVFISGSDLIVKLDATNLGTVCGDPNDDEFIILGSNPSFKNLYAMVLTAYAAERELKIKFDASASCNGDKQTIEWVITR